MCYICECVNTDDPNDNDDDDGNNAGANQRNQWGNHELNYHFCFNNNNSMVEKLS